MLVCEISFGHVDHWSGLNLSKSSFSWDFCLNILVNYMNIPHYKIVHVHAIVLAKIETTSHVNGTNKNSTYTNSPKHIHVPVYHLFISVYQL